MLTLRLPSEYKKAEDLEPPGKTTLKACKNSVNGKVEQIKNTFEPESLTNE